MKVPRRISLFFDHLASQADAYRARSDEQIRSAESKGRTYRRKAQFLAEAIENLSVRAATILEVGCGSGCFTEALAARLPDSRIVATDGHEPMLRSAASRVKHPNVSFRLYDCQGEFDGDTFDVVCGVDVLHHLEHPSAALAHWRRTVRSGGALLLLESNPANPILFLRSLPHARERRFYFNTPRNLRRWTTEAGWTCASVTNLPFYLPSGPPKLSGAITAAEDLLHRGRAIWGRLSGLFFIAARA
jgi:ubiquinone/menaquinone biosynthesis C-methylase UbiE